MRARSQVADRPQANIRCVRDLSRLPHRTASPAARSAGFTLIEVAVVTLIIGILASFAVLSISGRTLDDQLQQEAQRTEAILELASDEAQLKGLQIGLRYTLRGYEFVIADDRGRWIPYALSGPLRARSWPEALSADLHIDGHLVTPAPDLPPGNASGGGLLAQTAGKGSDQSAPSDEQKNARRPQVILLSSGEMTAFVLDMRMPKTNAFYRLQADALGRFKLERLDLRS